MPEQFVKTFSCADLVTVYPHSGLHRLDEVVLVPLFHALSWQLQLALLHPNSVDRLGRVRYLRDENEYVLIKDVHTLTIATQWRDVNRQSFAELGDTERAQLPDRGRMPPQGMLMIKAMTVAGRDEQIVGFVHEIIGSTARSSYGNLHKFEQLIRLARELLADQPHPELSLDPGVAQFYLRRA